MDVTNRLEYFALRRRKVHTNYSIAHRHQLIADEYVPNELSESLLALLDLWTPLHILHPHSSLHRSPHHCLLLLLLLPLLPLLLLLLLKHELLQLQLL